MDFSWSHIEILGRWLWRRQSHSAGLVRAASPIFIPPQSELPAARDDAITRTKHQAPTYRRLTTTTAAANTATYLPPPPTRPTLHAAVPPLLVSLVRAPPVSLPSCQRPWRMCLPSYIYPGLSFACAKTTPTPTAISIIHKNILPPRTLAKQILCLQPIAQSHCQHPSTSLSARTGCESRTFAASPVPRPSAPLPAV